MNGPDWGAAYRHYDDDALAALASAGLLRRAAKDVEAGRVGWHPDGGALAGVVAADGQRVQLAPQGPGVSRCDCPAPGVCKHILAAALWLRAAPAPAPAAAVPAAAPAVLDDVLALDPAAVFKAAGLAATRKAAALCGELEGAGVTVQGGVLVITVPALDLVCRYVAGAGFDGMVSETPPRSRKALHVLALAAAWQLHGREVPWPAPRDADAGEAEQADDERRILAQARAIVHEICAGGWSHVSDIAAPQLRALATSARVDAFPRLAGLLRSLAGTADLLARRDFGADERQAFLLAAEVHALVDALDGALARGDTALASALRGTARRSFAAGATVTLLPLGAYWWEQRSGARGLTVACWDPSGARVLQAVLARRDASDRQFGKAGAWHAHALWQGAGPAATLAGTSLILEMPRLADDGRLGVGGATRAGVLPGWRLDDDRWQRAGFDDWTMLRTTVAAGAGLLGERTDLLLLRPTACMRPHLDEVRQEVTWLVRDHRGDMLPLRLPYERWKAQRLDNLESWVASGAAIAGIVAHLDRDGAGGLLEPVTILVERDGSPHAVSLDFERGPARSGLGASLARMLARHAAPAAARPPLAHQRTLDILLAQLERKAMTGHLHLADPDDALRPLHGTLLALGLDALAGLLAHYLASPDTAAALRLAYAAQTCAALDTTFLQPHSQRP